WKSTSYQGFGPVRPLSEGSLGEALANPGFPECAFTKAVSLFSAIIFDMSGKVLNASSFVHASMGVPPTLELISPIGTLYFSYILSAKKYATAEKGLISSVIACCHDPLPISSAGPEISGLVGTLKCLISG